MVRAITFLFDNRHILSQGLLGILELSLQPLDVLLVHDLVVGLFEGYCSAQVLDFAIGLSLYS